MQPCETVGMPPSSQLWTFYVQLIKSNVPLDWNRCCVAKKVFNHMPNVAAGWYVFHLKVVMSLSFVHREDCNSLSITLLPCSWTCRTFQENTSLDRYKHNEKLLWKREVFPWESGKVKMSYSLKVFPFDYGCSSISYMLDERERQL